MNHPWVGGLVQMTAHHGLGKAFSDVFQNTGYLPHGKVGSPQPCTDNTLECPS